MRASFIILAALAATAPLSEVAAKPQRFEGLPCVTHDVEGDGGYNPVVVISNNCSAIVAWRICINYTARLEREFFEGYLQQGESARIETYPTDGEQMYYGGWAAIHSDIVPDPEC
jgi:hypothetical protein